MVSIEKYTEQGKKEIEEKYVKLEKSKAWFDTKYIKDEEQLTQEQIAYLRKYSITIIGLWPLNALVRKQWDLVIILVIIYFLLPAGVALLEIYSSVYLAIALTVVPSIWWLYFSLKHGRRLAWNRNEWKSFESFEKSERVWALFAWITVAFYVLLVAIGY
ncbi:MAG: hypothetical protein HYY86_03590 [Candidatus Harrisonbacteria bacterium]|nr:hypothetical protein [Candidatus Harrisonbacteria bacterium]